MYLVGAGPGTPGLLTLKGKRCLEEAEVVVYDCLVDPRILTYAHPKAELIYAGKAVKKTAMSQGPVTPAVEGLALYVIFPVKRLRLNALRRALRQAFLPALSHRCYRSLPEFPGLHAAAAPLLNQHPFVWRSLPDRPSHPLPAGGRPGWQ